MDRLITVLKKVGNPSVVGLDPKPQILPQQLTQVESVQQLAQSYLDFNRSIIDAVTDLVAVVKPQIAMYEALGPVGLEVYCKTTAYASSKGLYVLGDVKRGDIGTTAAAYASHLAGSPAVGDLETEDLWHEDAITVNPFLGYDGIHPFLQAAEKADKDIFVLCSTSNPSSSQLQALPCDPDGTTVSQHLAELIELWGQDSRGSYGFSRIGAVVGATHPDQASDLRARLPHTFLLVPGYEAQGGTAADVAALFTDNSSYGASISSSRGIIAAWQKDPSYRPDMSRTQALDLVAKAARKAARQMRDDLTAVLN